MIRFAALSLVLSVAPAAAAADLSPLARASLGIETDQGAALYAGAMEDALAFRLDQARSGFRQLAAVEPGPAAVYGLESTALWRALMTETDDDFDRFYVLNDSLASVTDRLGEAPGARLVAAMGKLHRALAFGRQERYARAGNAFRDACGLFRTLEGADADYGRGVCEVAAGAVPRQYKFLARLFGFRGSVAGGLARLDAASQAGGAMEVDATVAFAVSDATLNERRAGSVDRLVALADAHADSPLLGYLAGYHLLLDRRAAEAETALRRSADLLTADGVVDVPFVQAYLGFALFRQQRFAEAATVLDGYTRAFRGRSLVAQATLDAGIAYEMAGDRAQAERLYRRVRASRDYDSDQSAAREAARRLASPLSASDRALVRGGSAYDAGDYADAVQLLQPVVTDASLSEVARAEAAYRTARAYQAQERWDDALRHFQLAMDRPGDPLAKWGPWSVYHAGEVWEAKGDRDQAAAQYRQALENETEFDYHKALEQRTRAALERIQR